MPALALATALVLAAPAPPAGASDALRIPPLELTTFTLSNGLVVTLAPDHRLPQVVVNTWFHVGSKDEAPGRTGFAHLFEHLMFMGTARVPGNAFDVRMEQGGGANNASTMEDRTNYYSLGPSSLLPTLLWLDADRFQGLADAMTQEKLDLQREVVRNERRQSYENTPYGASELLVPEAMFPEGHPYHHSVIGSHADLQAASLDDVKGFFRTYYVPGNASLVVAGDFDPAVVRPMVEQLFGALSPAPVPSAPIAAPVRLASEVRRVTTDQVELPRLSLVWHAPPAYAPGTAELDLLSDVLAEGPSSRLDRRLVQALRVAESVSAYLEPRQLGSLFRIDVTGTPGADLDLLKRETLAVLADLAARGPTDAELRRVRAQAEVRILRLREHLGMRADKLNDYRTYLGVPDGFALDLARYRRATVASVRAAAATLGGGRLDLRVLPAAPPGQIPDAPPAAPTARPFDAPAPAVFHLQNGLELRVVRRPGTGLLAGHLLLRGGGSAVPGDRAGLASIVARLLLSGAGGRSGPAFADAVRALGASIEARATPTHLDLSLTGLAEHLGPTLDLLADAARRPALAASDFEREAALAVARVKARADEPQAVAPVVAAAAVFGREDPRGRPVDGWVETVGRVTLADVQRLAPRLLDPRGGVLVIAGDVEPEAVRKAVEARFGGWRGAGPAPAETLAPAPPPRPALVLVDRPGAAQTTILAARPVTRVDEPARAVRQVVNTALGGSFTSRLNQNLREKHGYTYGARSRFTLAVGQPTFIATAAVQTDVTGPALGELRNELDGLAQGGLEAPEVAKAAATTRHNLVERVQTSEGLADLLAEQALEGRPPDALRREAALLPDVTASAASAEAKAGPYRFDGLTVVLVGDAAKVVPQLEKAGFRVTARLDPEARPAPAPPN
jgi:predicted Zn-dependent peptidase